MESGWKFIADYSGQHPGYCELDDAPHPVSVALYARGNDRVGVDKDGQVVFRYKVNTELLRQLKGGTR